MYQQKVVITYPSMVNIYVIYRLKNYVHIYEHSEEKLLQKSLAKVEGEAHLTLD